MSENLSGQLTPPPPPTEATAQNSTCSNRYKANILRYTLYSWIVCYNWEECQLNASLTYQCRYKCM